MFSTVVPLYVIVTSASLCIALLLKPLLIIACLWTYLLNWITCLYVINTFIYITQWKWWDTSWPNTNACTPLCSVWLGVASIKPLSGQVHPPHSRFKSLFLHEKNINIKHIICVVYPWIQYFCYKEIGVKNLTWLIVQMYKIAYKLWKNGWWKTVCSCGREISPLVGKSFLTHTELQSFSDFSLESRDPHGRELHLSA